MGANVEVRFQYLAIAPRHPTMLQSLRGYTAIGWDVNNLQSFAEQYQEVIHEAKVRLSGAD